MKPLRFAPCAAAVLLLGISSVLRAQAPAQASPEPASFERLDDLLSHDQIADAAGELAAIAVQAAPARPAVNPAQEEILRRAIESGRSHLAAAAPGSQERRASRQLLCLARAYFEEELPEPPSKTQEAAEPLRVGGEVRRPEIVGMIKPPYSQEAREKRVSGTVILEAVIDREGCVRNSRVLKGQPFGLNEAATAAARNWTFEPATLNGEPVKAYYVLMVNFQVEEKKGPAQGTGERTPR